MDLNRNIRFFKQSDLPRTIGAVLAVAGLIWFFFGWSAASYYGPCIMVPVGAVMFIVCAARAVPESELQQNVTRALEGLGEDVMAEERRLGVLKNPAPFCAQGDCFNKYATMFRRGKDAKVISDVACRTMLFFTADALLVRGRRVSLSTGEIEQTELRLDWNELECAQVEPYEVRVRLTNTKKGMASVRGAVLRLMGREGQVLYTAPIHDDMEAEHLCANILRFCEQAANRG